jgi:2-polyprenyl-3-methyl-5-hydroxy-6-metoxy-1,4-benzoquinol methylase
MPGCCDPSGYDDVFGERYARTLARRYRRRGLDRSARRMVGFLEQQGLAGASVLEIGGGVGGFQLELLRRGAVRATNLELVRGYDEQAAELAAAAGVAERVERRILDIATDPDAVEPADVVVLHGVVCCYPDYERLLRAAADHARRLLVFSHPPRNVASQTVFAVENAMFRLRRRRFRAFTHPPEAMIAVLTDAGLRLAYRHRGPIWQSAGLERPAA